MNKVVVTTEIDAGLNQALEEIARFDNRSPSDLVDQAIRNLVEERLATRELVRHGLRLVDAGDIKAIDRADVHDWLMSDEEEFPTAR
jgi:predicted transcriptional regulator